MAENTKVNVTKQVAEGVDRKSKKVFGSVASLGGPAALYYDLGTPIAADVDRIVVSVDMKIGEYTIAAQPDVPRIITCTRTVVSTADTVRMQVIILGTSGCAAIVYSPIFMLTETTILSTSATIGVPRS